MRHVAFVASLLLAATVWAANPEVVILDVQNMTCAVCPITVRKALEKVPGVAEATVDFDKKTATVRFDPNETTPGALTKAVTDAGYPATVRQ